MDAGSRPPVMTRVEIEAARQTLAETGDKKISDDKLYGLFDKALKSKGWNKGKIMTLRRDLCWFGRTFPLGGKIW